MTKSILIVGAAIGALVCGSAKAQTPQFYAPYGFFPHEQNYAVPGINPIDNRKIEYFRYRCIHGYFGPPSNAFITNDMIVEIMGNMINAYQMMETKYPYLITPRYTKCYQDSLDGYRDSLKARGW